MARYPREGATTTYVVLGIAAFVLIIIFISLYLFRGHHEKTHTDKPQSSYVYPVSRKAGFRS
jgi:hypothetical protein